MRPSKLLLQFVRLVSLFPSLRSFVETHGGLFERGPEVWDSLPLLSKDFRRLGDILETGVILITELAQLSATEEELV